MVSFQNHYEVLCIAPGADFKAVKGAYYKRVKECHPDLFGGSRQKEEEFKILVLAFDVLSDPVKRSIYDNSFNFSSTATGRPVFEDDGFSVMDSPADDILEEVIVGNDPPEDTTLATLFLDLERTEAFMAFREAKNLFYEHKFKGALYILGKNVRHAPNNILYRYYMANACAVLGKFGDARLNYSAAINIGRRRIPPQRLQRIHDELDSMLAKQHPWWIKVVGFLGTKKDKAPFVDAEGNMITEANRAIANIMAERRRIEDKKKQLPD